MELSEQYMLEIVKWGSLTMAAKHLGISQPALSLALTNLEKKLGFTLIDRKSKPVCFTEEGSIYAEYLRKRKELTIQMQKEISDVGMLKRKVLSVGGSAVYIESLVADVIPELLRCYPECQIDMHIEPLEELIQNAVNGDIECFVCTDEKNIPDNFTLLPIRQERLYMCVPSDYEINGQLQEYRVQLGEEKPIRDYRVFEQCGLIRLPATFPLQRKMDRFFAEKEMQMHSSICVSQVSTGVALAEKGLGMVVASEEALMGRHLDDRVCLYSLPEEISGRKIYIAYDSGHYISKVCRMFIQLMTKGQENNENIKEN